MEKSRRSTVKSMGQFLKVDILMLFLMLILIGVGLMVLYSAVQGNMQVVQKQIIRLGVGLLVLFVVAQVPPTALRFFSPPVYVFGLILLACVLLFGVEGKGAQRWISLGFVRVQPSELMKLAMPMMVAWFLSNKKLPPSLKHIFVSLIIVFVPTLMILKQPDLGTSILVAASGIIVIFLAGVYWRYIAAAIVACMAAAPAFWASMHAYQKQRVMTLLNPESDPLGSGYHIIQSKIAIGSGGLFGKGWLNGTQSHLDFLPERHTDFIFSVFSEEFGWFGVLLLLLLYVLIVLRGLGIAVKARDDYSRMLAGSISLTFFVYLFVNVAMVTGLVPVVGVPLPLVSYGGTSFVTLMIGFGMLMSIASDKRMIVR